MTDVCCPLRTCAKPNDLGAKTCWNCGGPLPQPEYTAPGVTAPYAGPFAMGLFDPQGNEVRGLGYQRVSIARLPGLTKVWFPTPQGHWGPVLSWKIFDAKGNVVFEEACATGPVIIGNGDDVEVLLVIPDL